MQIESNVWQMGDANDALDEDGALIKEALDEHKDVIGSVLKRTGINLRKLKWSELREKYGVMLATAIFCACCTFVIMRRLRVFVFIYFILAFIGLKSFDKHVSVNNKTTVNVPVLSSRIDEQLLESTLMPTIQKEETCSSDEICSFSASENDNGVQKEETGVVENIDHQAGSSSISSFNLSSSEDVQENETIE